MHFLCIYLNMYFPFNDFSFIHEIYKIRKEGMFGPNSRSPVAFLAAANPTNQSHIRFAPLHLRCLLLSCPPFVLYFILSSLFYIVLFIFFSFFFCSLLPLLDLPCENYAESINASTHRCYTIFKVVKFESSEIAQHWILAHLRRRETEWGGRHAQALVQFCRRMK